MKHIVITECHDVLQVAEDGGDLAISPSQADELAVFIEEQKLKKEYISWGNKSVTFVNYVGFIQCATFSLEILPKITLHNDFGHMRNALIGMLNECGYIDVTTSNMAQLELMEGSLLEIFGRIYASTLLQELNKGISSKYQQLESNLMALKGALVVSKHIKENLARNKRYMAYCEYEERIIDYELNQIFVAANRLLLRNIKNLETQKLLRQIEHALDDVTYTRFSKSDLTRVKLDRTTNRYRTPFLLAKQLLLNVTSSFSARNQTSFSFLFEMNDLFEKYIASLTRKVTEATVHIQHDQYRLLIKESTNRDIFQLKPDIVIDNGTTQIIIDTKWKVLTSGNRSGVKREDLFQLYAYLTRYERLHTAILLYPQQIELGMDPNQHIESWYLHADENKKLKVYAVSLGSKSQTIDELRNVLHVNGM